MPKKKDPSITFLNKFGYNVVKLPRVGIEPMDIVGKDDTTQWLGPLHSVWTSTTPEPLPGPPRPAAAVNGQKTDALDVSLGLKVLANALSAFGATVPSLDMAFHRARRVQFAYTNVIAISVSPFDAGNYLTSGTLKTDNPVVKHYFLEPESEAYLIVEVLKSDSITVTASDEHGVAVGVDVPAIQGVVGANVAVKSGGGSNSTLTFTGPQPVTFGFIVQEIHRENDVWQLQGVEASGETAFGTKARAAAAGAGGGGGGGVILSSSCRLRV